ncbi:MAG: PQQ-binding-like beta-propeller repeat protein [Dysgonamonadaceae bacterium]|jgi:outer membrane protein assembly factor BamB|nr:PQQ-binding-like beta-propeller repeat protein [Dysgonamonadaceae bacterium]
MKLKNILSLIVLSLLILSSCTGGSGSHTHTTFGDNTDWKIFRGDPALSGFTNISLPRNPILKWTYSSNNRTAGSPIVHNGVTYWSDRRGRIYGVDINGNLVFEYDLQTAVDASPMIYKSTLYIGRIDGYMTAIPLAEKEVIWSFETLGQISGSANIVEFEGRTAIVFGSYDNYLYCLDASTGEELSRFASGNFINGAAAVWENYVLFGGCDSWIRVIDTQTGTATDSLQLQTYVPNSPAIMGNIGFVGDHSGNIYKIQLEDGRIVHHEMVEYQDNDAGSNVAVPAISPDAVYFYSGRHLYAVNRTDGTLMWSQLLSGNTGESSPVVANDHVIACTRTGIISIFDAKSGELLWEYDTGEQILGSPAVIEGHFMVLTSRGTLLCFGNE